MENDFFQSPTWGKLEFGEVLKKILSYIHAEPNFPYRIIIGTDSTMNGERKADFVTALIVHRVGAGGIYFWQRFCREKLFHLRSRIYEEALASLRLAENLIAQFREKKLLEDGLEIHVDIGHTGATREMVSEVVAMIRANGFVAKVKPEAFGASKVADRHV